MKDQFPLCKELGLEVKDMGADDFVYAADLEALLAKGVRVCSYKGGSWHGQPREIDISVRPDTFTGLVIGIKPIEQDSLEKLALDIIEARPHQDCMRGFKERARKLMGYPE